LTAITPTHFIERLLPLVAEKKLGVIAMKIPAYGRLLRPSEGVTIRDAFNYSLSQPNVSCGIIACDSVAMLEEKRCRRPRLCAYDERSAGRP
jgi:hypothetical protein